eukprot:TRINITY_DN1595_c0_g1_i2.p1 TRINITY_DN1595_c0_g1~~TRINITY_DN1595_c0_g1_i2.p1  ORF type:complete len:222 (-),score=40.28 TRINITY_DN1595_c0_g1_i2:137-802(-)
MISRVLDLAQAVTTPNVGSFNQKIAIKRREKDIAKLLMSDYIVEYDAQKSASEMTVVFHGPSETPYEGGVWKINVHLPDEYPYKSPSIAFQNKILHPNIHESTGAICLDVLNQTWSPMFDLVNVFDVFIPQLLSDPNPSHPLNPFAGMLYLKNHAEYIERVKEYTKRYAMGKGAHEDTKFVEEESKEQASTDDIEKDEDEDAPSDFSQLTELSDLEPCEEH